MHFFSPAKINLNLQVTGRRDDGYHTLSSLVCFARDVGDMITLKASNSDSLTVSGPYAQAVDPKKNSILDTLNRMRERFQNDAPYKIHLEKNLPVAAGIGGGSGNTATVIRALCNDWGIPVTPALIHGTFALGADVPVCLVNTASIVTGAGEHVAPLKSFPDLYAVLVNPNIPCKTKNVFKDVPFTDPPNYEHDIMHVIQNTQNDLTNNAIHHVPKIQNCLSVLNDQPNCVLSRMSGSGATCFGLFERIRDAEDACRAINSSHSDWWVKATELY